MEECSYQTEGPLNKEAWIDYIKNCFVPIYVNLKALDEFGNYLDRETSRSVTLDKINQDLLPFFIGGINEKGEYVPNSLASIIKKSYGIYVDPKALSNYSKINVDFSKIPIMKENYPILKNFKDLEYNLETLFRTLKITIPSVDEITNIEQFRTAIQDLENSMIQILPMYNYYSFVITSTRHILGPMLESQYPEIYNDKSLQDFLGMEKIPLSPPGNNLSLDSRFSLFIHGKNRIADMIFRIIYLSVVRNKQVINDLETFINSFLNTEFFDLDKTMFKSIISYDITVSNNLSVRVIIGNRYYYNKVRIGSQYCYDNWYYHKEYNITELLKDKNLNLILFLNPSLNISVHQSHEYISIESNYPLLLKFQDSGVSIGSEVSISDILG
ncbi:hypothetical protein [Acidianus manzaensis]|uniref:Uncharacterized protein n=1 Tax=Acidianus manzaensis TaxID=282676 RepID=A0A1W6K3E5_9CREN|nr:hypothetical protein [Acidianus manzaensis]ARM76962.1 hypothetical protein B6F84_13675 [Acidianus manzaensis]